MDVFEELKRIIMPFNVEQIDNALADRPSTYDVDARWYSSHEGPPKTTSDRTPFNGDALLAGMQAVCLLGTYLPAGDPRRPRSSPGSPTPSSSCSADRAR